MSFDIFDLAEVNYAFARNYRFLSDPAEINQGNCYIWAYAVYQLVGDSRCILCTVLTSYGDHAFIKYNNKFYDSESLNGEDDWNNLKFFNYHIQSRLGAPRDYYILNEFSEKEFIRQWRYLDLRWKVIYDSVLEYYS